MPRALCCKGIAPHVCVYSMVFKVTDMGFVKSIHLGRKQKNSMMVDLPVSKKTPTKNRFGNTERHHQ
jgi:hypothetical protein